MMAGLGWSGEETRLLISLWEEANVQSQLARVSRNRIIYEQIARDMESLVYNRTWEQCRTKIKSKRYSSSIPALKTGLEPCQLLPWQGSNPVFKAGIEELYLFLMTKPAMKPSLQK